MKKDWEEINQIRYETRDDFSGAVETVEGYCIGNAEVYMENGKHRWEGIQTLPTYMDAVAYQSGCWEEYCWFSAYGELEGGC